MIGLRDEIFLGVVLKHHVPLRVPYVSSTEKCVRFVQVPRVDGIEPGVYDEDNV